MSMKGVLLFMTTNEKLRLERLQELREKREAKNRAKIKSGHRKKAALVIALTTATAITACSIYNASAKEITITEINEFTGTNESRTVKTRSEKVEEILEEHGVEIEETDRINMPVTDTAEDQDNIIIKRGKRVKIKNGDSEEIATVTTADVTDALVEAGYVPGEYDQISVGGDLADGGTIELVSVSHTDETVTETIERGVDYVDDSTLAKGEERVVDEGYNGTKEVKYGVTYRNGQESVREAVSENVTLEPKNKVIARGTGEKKRAENNSAASSVSDTGGTVNGHRYKRKITMTATAYTADGSRTAMGTTPRYGVVAVDPKVVPLGSKVYVTAADGSWTYGIASAEDTGGVIKGNKIDLYHNTEADAMSFGRRSCVVYVLE